MDLPVWSTAERNGCIQIIHQSGITLRMNENNVKDSSTDTIQPPQINRMKEEIVVYTHCTQGLWGNAIPLGRNQKL